MNKIIVTVFDDEASAFGGLSGLKDLHNQGDISIYATAVLAKNDEGVVSVKQEADSGAVGAAVGFASGAFVGLLAGPVGVLVGAGIGGLTGSLVDINKTGVDLTFVEEVSKTLSNGKFAVIADAEESWSAPVDTRMAEHNGIVFRRLRSEVVEDQYVREAAEVRAEIAHLEDELKEASEDAKAKLQEQIDSLKQKSKTIADKSKERIESLKLEADSKVEALQEQMKTANDKQKAKIDKRVASVKSDLEKRKAKFKAAYEEAVNS